MICEHPDYEVRPYALHWIAVCPDCGAILLHGATRTDVMMEYTRIKRESDRIREASA